MRPLPIWGGRLSALAEMLNVMTDSGEGIHVIMAARRTEIKEYHEAVLAVGEEAFGCLV